MNLTIFNLFGRINDSFKGEIKMKLELTEHGNISVNESNVMEIMRLIVENNISNVRHYLSKELGIEPTRYYSKVKEIAIKYPKYYEYYEDGLQNNVENMKEKLKCLLLYIGTFMKYGIELSDGTFRQFDIFDWFVMKKNYFDNLNRKELSVIIDELSKDPIIIKAKVNIFEIRKLISVSYNDSPGSYGYIIHRDIILNDEESGLTVEERKFLIDFFDKYDIPRKYDNYLLFKEKLKKQRTNPNDLFYFNLFIEENPKKGR